ncbi:4'-phosphopantetheinyl transferase superfamily protein [Campylobacter mucosalis]|uniref:4'-phosphopantetheinyl transferase superfamily protein n=1 Tax=Campylobacter mucosalis TaxID=202 RepID=UPI0014702FF8
MPKFALFITTKALHSFNLYKSDKRRLKKYPNLKYQSGFLLSRSLKWQFKLKDKICISHKKDICVIARSKRKIGIDIEELKERNFGAIMDFCFSDDEKNLVKNADDKLLAFYQIYTTKEAFIKLQNLGFSHLQSVNFNAILNRMKTKHITYKNFLITIVYKGK